MNLNWNESKLKPNIYYLCIFIIKILSIKPYKGLYFQQIVFKCFGRFIKNPRARD